MGNATAQKEGAIAVDYHSRIAMGLPFYSRFTTARVIAAREKAAVSSKLAWYIGRNPRNGDIQYEVFSASSSRAGVPYFPTVRSDGTGGGFCYSLDGTVIVWISCTCKAAERLQPCWHSARCQLRLEREARATRRKVKLDEPNEPA